jgi:choline dehydrogenase-like flavoprotein
MGSTSEAKAFVSHAFTHLVVGGGTAGLVVAARLSENPALTVGILEAGPVALDEPTINVPGRLGETLFTKYDWQFETTPQPGFNGRKLPWNRGKVLGGSSAVNFMMWTRGSREDYDAWEKLGNKGWGWEGILSVIIPLAVCSSVSNHVFVQSEPCSLSHPFHGLAESTLKL